MCTHESFGDSPSHSPVHSPSQVCPRAKNISLQESRSYCTDFCASHAMDDYKTSLNDSPGRYYSHAHEYIKLSNGVPSQPKMGRCISGPKALVKTCKHYKHVALADELTVPNHNLTATLSMSITITITLM